MPRRDEQAIALLEGTAGPATSSTPGSGLVAVANHVVDDVAAVSFIVPRGPDSRVLSCIYVRRDGEWTEEGEFGNPWGDVSFDRPPASAEQPLLDWPGWGHQGSPGDGWLYVIPGQAAHGVAMVHARASNGSIAVAPVVPETGFFVVLGRARGHEPAPIELTVRAGSRVDVSTIEPGPAWQDLPDGPMIERR